MEKTTTRSKNLEERKKTPLKVKVKLHSRVWLIVTPRTVAHQAPPSMEFSRQEYCNGLSLPSPGDLPDPGIEPWSPTLRADALPSEPLGIPLVKTNIWWVLWLPCWLRWQGICPQCGRPGFDPWVRKIPWRRKGWPIPVLLPGELHGQRNLVNYSPQGCKESDMNEGTEHAWTST